jgi:hypothetical protein
MEQKNLDIYGHPLLPWSRALEQLEAVTEQTHSDEHAAKTSWLATTRRGGRPHVAAVGARYGSMGSSTSRVGPAPARAGTSPKIPAASSRYHSPTSTSSSRALLPG